MVCRHLSDQKLEYLWLLNQIQKKTYARVRCLERLPPLSEFGVKTIDDDFFKITSGLGLTKHLEHNTQA